jgi:hypothetical protein
MCIRSKYYNFIKMSVIKVVISSHPKIVMQLLSMQIILAMSPSTIWMLLWIVSAKCEHVNIKCALQLVNYLFSLISSWSMSYYIVSFVSCGGNVVITCSILSLEVLNTFCIIFRLGGLNFVFSSFSPSGVFH